MATISWGSGHIIVSQTWTEFVARVQGKGLTTQVQWELVGNTYVIWCVDGTVVYCTTVWTLEPYPADLDTGANAAALAAFQAGWMLTGNRPIEVRTDIGLLATSNMNVTPDSSPLDKSWEMEVAPETMGILDIWIGDDLVGQQGLCFLEGGEYYCATSAAWGSAVHFCLVDRDDTYGAFIYYGLQRTRLSGLTGIVGTIEVGEYVTGGTSGKTSRVLAVGSDWCEVTYHQGPMTDGESLTFSGGATATLGTWDEGDFLELVRNVKDDRVIGYRQRRISPGGAKVLPSGLYFRVMCYNAHVSENLLIITVLSLARK